MFFSIVENKYTTYEQRVANIPSDALFKQMNVLDKVTDNALKVRFNSQGYRRGGACAPALP